MRGTHGFSGHRLIILGLLRALFSSRPSSKNPVLRQHESRGNLGCLKLVLAFTGILIIIHLFPDRREPAYKIEASKEMTAAVAKCATAMRLEVRSDEVQALGFHRYRVMKEQRDVHSTQPARIICLVTDDTVVVTRHSAAEWKATHE